jgi:hypothetical protein
MDFFHILIISAFIFIGTAGMIALQDAVSRMASFWLNVFKQQPSQPHPTVNFSRTSRLT